MVMPGVGGPGPRVHPHPDTASDDEAFRRITGERYRYRRNKRDPAQPATSWPQQHCRYHERRLHICWPGQLRGRVVESIIELPIVYHPVGIAILSIAGRALDRIGAVGSRQRIMEAPRVSGGARLRRSAILHQHGKKRVRAIRGWKACRLGGVGFWTFSGSRFPSPREHLAGFIIAARPRVRGGDCRCVPPDERAALISTVQSYGTDAPCR